MGTKEDTTDMLDIVEAHSLDYILSNPVANVDFEHSYFAMALVCSIAEDRHYMMDIRVAWLPVEPAVFAAMASFVWFVMVEVLDHCLV